MAEQKSRRDDGQPGTGNAGASGAGMVFGQETLDALSALAVAFDSEGHILCVNRAFTEVTGCANANVQGRFLWETPSLPEEGDSLRRRVCQLAQSRAPAAYEGHMVAKDGTRRWIVWADTPQVDSEGNLRAVVSIGIDFTTQRRVLEWDAFLSEAAAALASSLDLESALGRVARLAVPRLADWCMVYRMEAEREIRRIAIAHTDHDVDPTIEEISRHEPPRLERVPDVMARLCAGESILIEEVTDGLLEASASSKEHLELMRRLALRSAMLVPLHSRGHLLGAVVFVTTDSRRHYDQQDLTRAEILADRAAVAADNARLYAESQEAARRYQEALAQLELVLQSAPVGFAFLDRDLRYLRINEYLASYDRLSVEEHLGCTIDEIIGEKAAHIAPVLQQVIASGKPCEGLETMMERPGAPGQFTHWLSSYYPVRNHGGEVVGVGSIVMDITERRRMEDALRASEEATRLILDSVPANIAVMDECGVIARVNEAWERFGREHGGDPEKTGVGANYLEVCRRATGPWSEGAPECLEGLKAILDGTSKGFDLEYPCPSGDEMRWFLLRAVPLPAARGALAVHIDITDLKRLQGELQRRTSELDATFQALPDLYFRLDAEGTYLDIRAGRPKDLYAPVEQLLGRRVRDMLPPDATRQVEDAIHQALETGEVTKAEYTLPIKGDEQFFETRMSPLANGQVVAVARNITDKRRAEEALRASEERFRTLVERISDWIWEVDPEAVYTYASPRVRNLLGYEPEEVVGKTPFDFMPEDEAERVRREFEEIAGERRAFSGLENRAFTKDGRIVVMETSGTPILDERGRLLGYRGADRDITERKRAEEAHRFLAEASRVLTETLDAKAMLANLARLAVPTVSDWCIIYTIDENDTVHRVALEHINPGKDELARRLLALPAPDLGRVAPTVQALRTGRPQLMPKVPEHVLRALATSPEHLDVLHELAATTALVVPLHTRGKLLGVIHLFMTDSGRRYDEETVALADALAGRAAVALDNARLYEEATAANAAKDQFLAVLSHELRNPLAPILAGAAVLKRVVTDDTRVQRTVGIIERNVKLQARLVNDLLDLSRIKRGKIRLQRVPTQLDSVVQAAVQTQRPEAEEAGLDVQEQLQTGLWVHGDPDRLQQVVMNLLTNAIKFTPQPGQVCVRLEQVDGAARITVSDTGIGISPDLLPNLFAMFQQGEVSGRRAAGLGIGLSLVKSITELHGGSVRAESDGPGKGSRFIVELPLMPAPQAAPAPETPGSPARYRILLVEDNPDTRTLLAEGLSATGHTVHYEATGEEALEWLAHEHPDVIVSDIGLPGMDGCEMLRRARELPEMQSVPAFAVTGYGAPFDVERAREAGFDGHLTKPVDVGALDQRIRDLLADGRAAANPPDREPGT